MNSLVQDTPNVTLFQT